MRIAYLEDAEQSVVSDVVAAVLKERHALLTEHTASHARFRGLNPGETYSFAKGGYVGTYQHTGEREVEVRVRVDATGPARAFWASVMAGFLGAVGLYLWRPGSSTWAFLGTLLWGFFLTAFIVYLGTWRTSRALERSLMDAIVAEVAARAETDVATEEDREIARLEDELEAEILALKLRTREKASRDEPKARGPVKPRLTLRFPFRKARRVPVTEDDDPEDAKRARIAALKEEIARRRGRTREDEPRQDQR